MARLSPIQLSSDKWAYINSGNVEIYWQRMGDGQVRTEHVKLLKSELRKLIPFIKTRKRGGRRWRQYRN